MAGQENNSPIGEEKSCPNPTCQFDKHSVRANFCILCGTLLYRRCDDCIAENPMYAKFCHYCGANLEEMRLDRMQQPDEELVKPSRQTAGDAANESDAQETEDERKKGTAFDIS